MPSKPKKPCACQGCPNLTHDKYCKQHQELERDDARAYNRYKRDPLSNKRYGRAWKRIRDRYIQMHPLCEECKDNNEITVATEVHHILPLAQGGTHDISNLRSLCHVCHMRCHGT